MVRSRGLRQGALIGLALTLLALTALSLVGVGSTRRSAEQASRSVALAEAYQRAYNAVAAEESLERKYRLEPSGDVRARHVGAGEDLRTALLDIDRRGDARDKELVARLRVMHEGYATAIDRMFTAVDDHDAALVLRIDGGEVDPVFERISGLVQESKDQHTTAATLAVARLQRVEGLVFVTTTAGFAVGLLLLVGFALVVVGYQRRLLRQAQDSEHQALHDALTGLPNRTLFTARLELALEAARPAGEDVAVLVVDLDRFKDVNDMLGHQYGDALLCQVAVRAGEALRAGDTIARLSGDEFAALMPGVGAADALALAERLLHRLHHSFLINDVAVDVEAGIGVAVAPTHATSADAILRCADIALSAAKDDKTGVVLYRDDMSTEDDGRPLLLGDLRRALDAGDQLILHYQPKVDLRNGDLDGVEALIRWQHPARGLIPPADFIPVAETTGLINRLTTQVLRMSVTQARAWLDEGLRVPVAVNLSPRCLLDPGLVKRITGVLEQFQVPSALLRLEVTETALMANPALATKTLTELHECGIRLSIDDYGTGYSSMAHLKRLPVDELKIDRSFVQAMHVDQNDAVLVRGAIDLGHNLGLTVVAEGVDDAAHVTSLRELGCDVAQGYHYAHPKPASELTPWIRAHQPAGERPAVPQ